MDPAEASRGVEKTRPDGASGSVSTGDLGELLEVTPENPGYYRGRLEGVRRGGKARLWLGLLAVVVPLGLWAGVRAVQAGIEAHRFDIPFAAAVPRGEDATMRWNEGHARLGLHENGVRRIEVPGAVITLKEGCGHAQVWVEVVDGELRRVKELVGKVVVARLE